MVGGQLVDLVQAVTAFVVGEGRGEVQVGLVDGDVANVEET